jgi:ferredoxin/flavodoxin---NADP+ reductase
MPSPDTSLEQSRHVVVIVGGAVAGSEAALACAERGAWAIVLEQGERPFGKIEDGLPRWHEKLRIKEYEHIARNLAHPNVSFVPCTRVGTDVTLTTILREWAVSALILGSGAWRDRPLFDGAEAHYGRGLVPQNAFVHWYNHYPDKNYSGPRYTVHDDALVVGGGLASIDVAKIINLELYKRALAAQGHRLTTLELEHEGIAPVLTRLGFTPEQLGVRGARLLYRRDKGSMPIAFAADDATPEQHAKVVEVRKRLMDKVIERYLVRFVPNRVVLGPLLEDGVMRGLRLATTRVEGERLVTVPGSEERHESSLVVSSIGSIPEPIPGLPQRGELIDFRDRTSGSVHGLDGVFGLGNVLTGKGNIKDSRRNALHIAASIAESYLGLTPDDAQAPSALHHAAGQQASALHHAAGQQASALHHAAGQQASAIADAVEARPRLDAGRVTALRAEVAALQRRVGYDGQLDAWLSAHERDVHELS